MDGWNKQRIEGCLGGRNSGRVDDRGMDLVRIESRTERFA